jgi:hypothetical protein
VTHLVGQLENVSPRLARVLAVLPRRSSCHPRRAPVPGPTHRRRANGEVARAVQTVLADGKPHKLEAIRRGVEELLGEPVSVESVSWCLRMGSRKETPLYLRPALGYYQLTSQT